ncbi:MAG: nicotinate-nucleotide adenylyltransferase [Dehalococcoidia bacterium]|nr:nicotinate-nucleotide adenylyltransferase [Dehalococcoidia bacterium]
MRVGVFGGTFDPIHRGHLTVARAIQKSLKLDKIVFVPAGQPWMKEGTPISPVADRVEMVRLALKRRRRFELSTIEAERPGPSYAVDTIDTFHRELGSGSALFFLLGSDALAEIGKWREPGRLLRLCTLVAFPRPGCPLPSLESLQAAVPGIADRIIFAQVPQVDLRATDIRRWVAEGRSIAGMVPRAVERYILEHGLYAPGPPQTT